ncbi:MAG TPA: M15 family metallopeptidase [Frankiaceae bacterium]|nr:M15 family metallopeptidase [Frankiaceae bacterium]
MRRALALLLVGPAVLVALRAQPSPGDAAPDRAPAPVAPAGTGDVTRLTPAVRRSVELAIAAARADGVELRVASGWRSAEHQRRLHAEAVAKYGSAAAARRWVLPPEESAHVRGEAVDVAPPSGADWLARHGVRFGLCRRYANEPWHFERLAGPKGSVCPPMQPHA